MPKTQTPKFPTPSPSSHAKDKWLKESKPDPDPISLDQIRILEEAFLNQASDSQACFVAKVSPSTLLRYEEMYPQFAIRKEQLRALVKYQAKKNIVEKVMEGDVELSKWFADRLLKDEGYSTRTELSGANGAPLIEIVSYKKREPSIEGAIADVLEAPPPLFLSDISPTE